MNAAQAVALVALFDNLAAMKGRPASELENGVGMDAVSVHVNEDCDIDGWLDLSVMNGGSGPCFVLDDQGDLLGETEDGPVAAKLVRAEDGTVDWESRGEGEDGR